MVDTTDNIVLSQSESRNAQYASSLDDRVYIERLRQFFGHAAGNMGSALFGAMLMGIVVNAAGAPFYKIAIWFAIITLFATIVAVIEIAFTRITLTISSASSWMTYRMVSGNAVAAMYGVTPFLFGDYLMLQQEMFIFVILSAMVSVASTGYSVIPYHYFIVNGVTMVPLTFYLLAIPTNEHITLAITAVIWQGVVLSKAWVVSKTSIQAIRLNECLKDEVEEHKGTKEQLRHLANHDGLTDLPNRRLLTERLDGMINWAHRYDKRVIIMFLDLDGFKAINDQCGHECGDRVLQEIAQRLQKRTRETDALARIGGDEFILAYSEVDDIEVDATMLANRILEALREPVKLPDYQPGVVSGSIGIALYPDNGINSGALLIAADEAMYAAKARGKNCFYFAIE